MRALLFFASLVIGCALAAALQRRPSCQSCAVLASTLENKLQALAANAPPGGQGSPDGDAGDSEELPSRRARSLPGSGLSEPAIMTVLDGFCSSLAADMQDVDHAHGPQLEADCNTLLTQPAKMAIEEHVYQHGPEGLQLHWCIAVADLCSSHTIIDSGEL